MISSTPLSGARMIALMPAPTDFSASMSSPLSVSSRIAKRGVHDPHLDHLRALLLAARKADVDRALEHFGIHAEQRGFFLGELDELRRRKGRFRRATGAAHSGFRAGTGGRTRRGSRPDIGSRGTAPPRRARAVPGRAKSARPSTSLANGNDALTHLIARPPRQHISQRRLARPVRPHDRMHLARGHVERNAVEDRLVGDRRVEVFNVQHSEPRISTSDCDGNQCNRRNRR